MTSEPRRFNNETEAVEVPPRFETRLPRNTRLVVSHQGAAPMTAVVLPDELQVILRGPDDWTVRFEHGLGDLAALDDVIRAAEASAAAPEIRDLLEAAKRMRAVFGPAGML